MRRFNVSAWALHNRGLVLYLMVALAVIGSSLLAARSLDSSEFLPEEGKRLLGIGRTNRNIIVSFQKIKYLRPGNTPALRKIDGKKTCRRRFIGKNQSFICKI